MQVLRLAHLKFPIALEIEVRRLALISVELVTVVAELRLLKQAKPLGPACDSGQRTYFPILLVGELGICIFPWALALPRLITTITKPN
jgi:hypothetical protein